MNEREETIKFFKEQIYQFEIMMNGIMNSPYRKYIEKLKRCYELAIEAIQEDME